MASGCDAPARRAAVGGVTADGGLPRSDRGATPAEDGATARDAAPDRGSLPDPGVDARADEGVDPGDGASLGDEGSVADGDTGVDATEDGDGDGSATDAADAPPSDAPAPNDGDIDPGGVAPDARPDVTDGDGSSTEDVGGGGGHPCEGVRPLPTPPAGSGGPMSFTDRTLIGDIPHLYSEVASVGDVDGDGRPDLFVPGAAASDGHPRGEPAARRSDVLLVNCGGRFARLDVATDVGRATASAVADLDGDGRLDLLVARDHVVEAWIQPEPLTFVMAPVWEEGPAARPSAAPDTPYGEVRGILVGDHDGDGDLDLLLARRARNPTEDRTRPDPAAANVLVRNDGAGRFQDRTAFHPELAAGSHAQSMVAALIPQATAGQPPWLYMGNQGRTDAIYRVTGPYTFEAFAEAHAPLHTHGVDYSVGADGSVLVATSSAGPFTLWHLEAGSPPIDASHRVELDTRNNHFGVVFTDLDNDGLDDIVWAAGVPETDVDEARATWGDLSFRYRLLAFRAAVDDDGRVVFRSAGAEAGDNFNGRLVFATYSLLAADMDRDGCVDLITAPLLRIDRPGAFEERLERYDRSVRLLRNDCRHGGRWYGARVRPFPGLRLRLTTRRGGDSVPRLRVVKGASSQGGASDPGALHFGLAPDEVVTAAELTCPDGGRADLPAAALAAGTWHDLRALCAPQR